MNVILFNKGKNKSHFKICIEQIKKYNNCKIYFLGTDDGFLPDYVDFFNIENLKTEKIKNFESLNYYQNHENPLWYTSTLRFFYIEEFMRKNNILDVFHFDNDVLIYDSFEKTKNVCKDLSDNIWLTPCNTAELVCGMMFIPNFIELSRITNSLIKKVSQGIDYLTVNYRHRSIDFMVNEMTLLKIISDEEKNISLFPIMPFGEFSEFFDKFETCYDPASWGQNIGGTWGGFPVGWAGSHHSIGRKILDGTFKLSKNGVEPPTITSNNKQYKLFNLHIHSKKLELYL